jgi:hypothetical protein
MDSPSATGEIAMMTLNTEKTKTDTAERELSIDELDSAAGGCPGGLGAAIGGIILRAIISRLF